MIKKIMIAIFWAAIISGKIFAHDTSIGLGGTFSSNSNEFIINSDGEKLIPKQYQNLYNQNALGGGFFLFADIKYVLLSLGMSFFSVTPADREIQEMLDKLNINYNLTYLNIGVFGKYPIPIGRFTLYPLTGLEAKISLAAYNNADGKNKVYADMETLSESKSKILDLSSLWLKIGAGLDFSMGKNFYLRSMFLYGFGLPNNSQKKFLASINYEKELGSFFNHGPNFKLAFGFIPQGEKK